MYWIYRVFLLFLQRMDSHAMAEVPAFLQVHKMEIITMKRKYILPLIILAVLAAVLFFGVRTRSMPDTIKLSQTNEDAVVYGANGWGESYSVNDYGFCMLRTTSSATMTSMQTKRMHCVISANCLHLE